MLALSSDSILGDPPVHSLAAGQLFIVGLAGTERERLLASEAKDSKHAEASVEQLVNPVLQRLVEVDQYVSAQDHIELVEGTVARKIVLGKQDVLPQRRPQYRALILLRIVFRKDG